MLPSLRLCARAAACAGLALWPFLPLPPGQRPLLAPSALLAARPPLAPPRPPPLAPPRPPPRLDFFL
jgi:hypothetical protein